MKFKHPLIRTAVAGILALGAAGQAQAYLHAGSSLNVDNLSIGFVDANNNPATQSDVSLDSFTFTVTNTAGLNNNPAITQSSCSGTPSSNTCGASAPDVLYAGPVNAPGSAPVRIAKDYAGADNTFVWLDPNKGPATGDWANADSIIHTAEAAQPIFPPNPTSTDQIAEAKLTDENVAASSSRIDSVTGFTFNFTVVNATSFIGNFEADPDMIAEAVNELLNGYDLPNAQATMAVNFNLSKDDGSAAATWAPQGTPGVNNCFAGGGLTCNELADTQDLNLSVGVTTDNSNQQHSYGPNVPGLTAFGLRIDGLTAGKWTLTLSASTSTQLSHRAIPEPSSLALLGLGLAGIGFLGRRRKQQA